MNAELFSGIYNGFQAEGQFVDIQDRDILKLRDFAQIDVIGDDLEIAIPGQ